MENYYEQSCLYLPVREAVCGCWLTLKMKATKTAAIAAWSRGRALRQSPCFESGILAAVSKGSEKQGPHTLSGHGPGCCPQVPATACPADGNEDIPAVSSDGSQWLTICSGDLSPRPRLSHAWDSHCPLSCAEDQLSAAGGTGAPQQPERADPPPAPALGFS